MESLRATESALLERSRTAGTPRRKGGEQGRSRPASPLLLWTFFLPEVGQSWLRIVDGRPVSDITTQFLSWSSLRLEAMGKKALLLIWDNACWHKSKFVKDWIAAHNRQVKNSGSEAGVRIVPCLLPKKSPWLNPIEPKWIRGKRK